MNKEEVKYEIFKILQETGKLILDSLVPDLDTIGGCNGVPQWHNFEHEIWKND